MFQLEGPQHPQQLQHPASEVRDEQRVGRKETILQYVAANALRQPLATAPSLSRAAHIALGARQCKQQLELVQRDPTEQGLKRHPPSVSCVTLV